ncbi:MAG: hypothetical protein QOC83_2013 [Pseudonocardiales bacterium]|jgi:hypothetical protein|nr:hypothetical protein [Pseudonocardiales bacterium]MDT7585344.1 hypothetical protein [Pseudonocardiales bacterium]MDT7637725.1 hypothetical protein [Pseudonocardiales bacterium]MDT7663578.1 hypothetical protein [Pseudonocardiales bacterium]MDT7669504.1 hypothetical protein [Pseudonocardiales bacterium]
MHEEVRPVDDVDRGSPGLAGRQGFDLAVKVATGAFDPKTLAPMTHNRTTYPRTTYPGAAGIGCQNVTAPVNPGSVL